MNRPLETKADLIQAWSGVATFVLLVIIAIAGLLRFAWIDKSLANLEAKKSEVEVEAATTPILAIEPTLVVGPGLGHQFHAVKLHVRAKNIGKGRLKLGTVSVQVSQLILRQDVADPLITASKRRFNDDFQPTIESTKVVPISRHDLNWAPVEDTKRTYRLDSSPTQSGGPVLPGLCPRTKFQTTPDSIRSQVAPPEGVDWQSKIPDLVAPFGPLPDGFGEAIMTARYCEGVVSAPSEDGKPVAQHTSVTDTLRFTTIGDLVCLNPGKETGTGPRYKDAPPGFSDGLTIAMETSNGTF